MVRQIDFCKHPDKAEARHHIMYNMFYDLEVPEEYKVKICNECHQAIHRNGKRECGVTKRGWRPRDILKYNYMVNKAEGKLQYEKLYGSPIHKDESPLTLR